MAKHEAPLSTSVGARDRRRERVRQELALAGIRLMEERGFDSVTADEIGRAADYSVATFWRAFPRKEDVVFFDLPARLQALEGAFAKIDSGETWPIIRKLLVADARDWEKNDAALPYARIHLIHREPAIFSRFLEHCQEWEDAVATLVAQKCGRDVETDVASRVMAGATLAAARAAMRAQRLRGGTFAAHLQRALEVVEVGPLNSLGLR